MRAVLAMLSKSTTPAVSKALALEDIAIFRAVHSSTLLYPSDAISLERLTETMVTYCGGGARNFIASLAERLDLPKRARKGGRYKADKAYVRSESGKFQNKDSR